jgi:preprotein translocase subunit SecG
MLLIVFLCIAALFIVLGIIFASGRGAGLIAGYNTSSTNEKAHTDEKKLLKAMSVFMFVLAGCFLVSALSEVFHVKLLIWIGQALFVVALITGLIYLNTGNRFRK